MALRRKTLSQRWKAGVVQTLDLRDPEHWDFLNERIARAGVTGKNGKAMMETLTAARDEKAAPKAKAAPATAAGAGLVPLNALASIGFSADGTFAGAFSAVPGGTLFTYVGIELLDPATGETLGHNSRVEYNSGEYVPIDVHGGRPSGAQVEAIFSVNYQVSGQMPVSQAVRMIVSDGADGSPSVKEPVKRKGDEYDPDLRVALGATRPLPGYDYWYRSDPAAPNLRLPLVGNARYQQPIAAAPSNVSLLLVAPSRGGVVSAFSSSLKALKSSFKVSGKKLSWSMPFSSDPMKDSSLQFGSAAWGEPYVLLVCTFTVSLKKVATPVLTTICSVVPSSPEVDGEQPGVAVVPPVAYIWR